MAGTAAMAGGAEVLLGEQFYQVGQRLEEPLRPDPVGPLAVLDPGEDAPFGQHEVGGQGQDDQVDQADLGEKEQHVD